MALIIPYTYSQPISFHFSTSLILNLFSEWNRKSFLCQRRRNGKRRWLYKMHNWFFDRRRRDCTNPFWPKDEILNETVILRIRPFRCIFILSALNSFAEIATEFFGRRRLRLVSAQLSKQIWFIDLHELSQLFWHFINTSPITNSADTSLQLPLDGALPEIADV